MNRLIETFRRGFFENVRFAFSAMREHKLRSGLTVLGIVVGVATVIAMVSIVTGFNNNVIGNLQAFGANRIEFQKYEDRFGPGGPSNDEEKRRPNLTMDDVKAMREGMPDAAAVSGLIGMFDAEIHVKNGSLEANNPYVLGVDDQYPQATAYTVGHGRFFTAQEIDHSALEVVIGSEVKDAVFPSEDPIGKAITLNGLRYTVVGVLEKKGEQFGWSPDNKVVLPYGTFEKQFGFVVRKDGLSNISVVPKRTEDIDKMIEEGTAILRLRRRVPFNKPNNFAISTPDQLIGQFRSITGGITGAMILIALISLLIGGVGVMNIMLVSVTQRTREIGIRKAVGAFRRDIVGQFLTEAVTLSSLGGVIGVLVGGGLAALVRALPISLPAAVPVWSVLVGLIVSMSVGIFFGAYPAVKASRLDPIESLRYE
jgi:putative ABC transport system permease protein